MNGQRIVILTGGAAGDWIQDCIKPEDLLIGADRGALRLIRMGYSPFLSLGDFDSVSLEELEEIKLKSGKVLTCDAIDKDVTDTEMAFDAAISMKPSEILLLGALGTRWDHSIVNIHLLKKGLENGIPSRIIDTHNEIRLINRPAILHKTKYTHVSILPFSSSVTGITLEGFKYPLDHATLQIGQSLGISNVMAGETGRISLLTGELLVIQSID